MRAPTAPAPQPAITNRPAALGGSPFVSLHNRNFRMFATGQLFSNTGRWVQRIAQDWLVLSLTGSATAVGITAALQFVPTVLFGLYGGLIADRFSKRRVLLCTQAGMGVMAAILAALTLSGVVEVWHVYAVAFGLGTIITVDNPARQAFVNEMVGTHHLRNAISLNSSVFQLGALVGPAISGVLISTIGTGWAFTVNALSFAGPLIALALMREDELRLIPAAPRKAGQLKEALRYVAGRNDLRVPIAIAGMYSMFTINLPVTMAAFAKHVFHSGAGGYSLLSAVVAVGSLSGALISATMRRPRLRTLIATAFALSGIYVVSALVPGQIGYTIVLIPLGGLTMLFLTSMNSAVQLAADDSIRGRVMGVYMLVLIGSGAIGGPLLGWIDEHFDPRIGMLTAGVVPLIVAAAVAVRLVASRGEPTVPRFAH